MKDLQRRMHRFVVDLVINLEKNPEVAITGENTLSTHAQSV